jgi:LPPG:FO 2-phospho-L-lactate transferase
MSNQAAPTTIVTETGTLPFQEWFVKERWQPAVQRVDLPSDVVASAQVTRALEMADLVLIAPSNPFVSIDPILNVYPIREMVMDLPRAVIAVSPIVGGRALKGPAAKMMGEMGLAVSVTAVAGYYGELIDGLVIDQQDQDQRDELPGNYLVTSTVMHDDADRRKLARETLEFALDIAA